VRYLREIEGKNERDKIINQTKNGIRNNSPEIDGRIRTLEMVWAHRKNMGREIPQNDLAH
jgi:hypothetical protein